MDIFSAHNEEKVRAALPAGGFGEILYRDFEQEVYRLRIADFSDPSRLKRFSETARENLAGTCILNTLSLNREISDKTNSTTRLLLDTTDGNPAETVIMRHAGTRNTVCVSSQSGCGMGCVFCATGRGGLFRNLHYWEIIDQVDFAARKLSEEGKRLRNVVFMGMGEPFANYENVAAAIQILTSTRKYGLAGKHVTVSTCGIPGGIQRLSSDFPNVSIILSLHASDEATRRVLMPAAKNSSAVELVNAALTIAAKKNHRGLIAYLMIDGITDTTEQGLKLAELLHGHNVQVNFIPYNPISALSESRMEFRPSKRERIENFRGILKAAGIPATVRSVMGSEISSACGQLSRQDTGKYIKPAP